MRAMALAVMLGLGGAVDALAQGMASLVDPQGQFTVEYPADWPVDAMEQVAPTVRQVVVGGADAECWTTAIDRPEWASAKPWDVRRTFSKAMPEADFLNMVQNSRVGDGAGALISLSMEIVNGWPVQLGEVATADTPVIMGWHARPGLELRIACRSYDGQDHSKTFRAIALSAASPKDAEWSAQIKEWDAKKAAAEAENDKADAAESSARAEKERGAEKESKKKR